jgi:hypothetical protein
MRGCGGNYRHVSIALPVVGTGHGVAEKLDWEPLLS